MTLIGPPHHLVLARASVRCLAPLGVTALLATGVPARRAANLDPAKPLRLAVRVGMVHTMTIFESAESAYAHIVATKLEGPSFELAMSDGMTFDGDPDLMGAGMALVLDAILAQEYEPAGLEQRDGYRLYRYTRME